MKLKNMTLLLLILTFGLSGGVFSKHPPVRKPGRPLPMVLKGGPGSTWIDPERDGIEPEALRGQGGTPHLLRSSGGSSGGFLDLIRKPIPVFFGGPESRPFNQILSDFQVNETATGRSRKYYPCTAANGSGKRVAVWVDNRNGYAEIFGQIFNSSGVPQGGNFKVTDGSSVINNVYPPSIAMNSSGNFTIVWTDERRGNFDIYGQRYNSSGSAQGGNFLIDDDQGTSSQNYSSIAMDGSGNFIVVWRDRRNGYSNIYGQRYNSAGTALGNNFLINDEGESGITHTYPAVAMDGSGNCLVVWEDSRNGTDIYGKFYDSSGTAHGVDFEIAADPEGYGQYDPAVAACANGTYGIAWEDDRNGDFDIYGKNYYSSSMLFNSEVRINDDSGDSDQYDVSVASLDSTSTLVAWEDMRNGNYDIYAQIYSSNPNDPGVNFIINDDGETRDHGDVSAAIDGSGNFFVVWNDSRNGNYDIFSQLYDSDGAPQGVNSMVNDDPVGSSSQLDPSIAMDGSGNFTLVWEDQRKGLQDVYGQRYNSSGAAQGSNFPVTNNAGSNSQYEPSIAADQNGNLIVVWQGYRNEYYDIIGQRYNSSGVALGENFLINDDVNDVSNFQDLPSVAADHGGNFIVVWLDGRNYTSYDIYGQRFNSSGTALGGNFLITFTDTTARRLSYYPPSVAMDGNGNFNVVWQDNRSGDEDIYGQRYNSSGTAQGSNYLINDDDGSGAQLYPSVAMDGNGNFNVVWQDNRNGNYDIYGRRYNSSGTAQGNSFLINDDAGTGKQEYPNVSMDDSGNFIVVWHDDRNGNRDIYAQCFNSNGTQIGGNFKVSNDTGGKNQGNPAVRLGNGRFVTAWEDNRVAGQGLDVFANINQFSSDHQAPSIAHTSTATGLYGQSMTISATITDDAGVSSATLFYRKGGTSAFSSVSMASSGGGAYQAAIPSASVTEMGVEYYITATDGAGNISANPGSSAAVSHYCIQVSYSYSICAYPTPANSYRMISIPGDVDVTSPGTVLEDDFGTYDRTRWRLLRGQNGSYAEYTIGSIENFEPGNAFWLITKDAWNWDTGPGKTVSTASPYVISLTQGWNMIGNPFAFSVAWSDVVKHGSVEAPWAYEGTGNSTSGYIGSQTRLLPWRGYCVYNDAGQATTIEIPAKEASGTAKASGHPARALETGEWTARIKAVCGSSSDLDNYAGCLADAEAEWDGNDFREAPPIGDYISVVFPHGDWKRHSGDFAGDFRPVDGQGYEWNFAVRTGIPHAEVRLMFEGFDSLPQGWKAVLIDESGKQRMNLNKGEGFSFLSGSGESSRSFRLLVGGEEYVQEHGKSVPEIPAIYQLLPNFPNPFNASTMISYTLPSQSPVSIDIYDALGRHVASLEKDAVKEAGYHHVIWDGRDLRGAAVSSGIYIVHLKAEGFVQRRKAALTR